MATTNKVFIQIDDERIELKGAELEAFLSDRAAMQIEREAYEAELAAKAAEKTAILERLGLTEDELKVVLS
jgi:hypothetical protein